MSFNIEFPWERYALIADLVRRFDTERITLGKTALQKIVFLLQRVFGFDSDYAYTLYTYGPFCADLARDLDIVEGFGGTVIAHDLSYGGYELRVGPATDELRRRGAEFLTKVSNSLDQLVADYGRATVKELELRSTIIYMAKAGRDNEELVRLVHQVKPHFSEVQIEAARRELDEKGYLKFATDVARRIHGEQLTGAAGI
jgi:uncharacterized protein YwgA